MHAAQREHIATVMQVADLGVQAQAAAHHEQVIRARRLGVARMTLYRRMKRSGIVAPNRRDGDDG
ncbi:MAG: hypothetical protein ACOZJX_22075 [Pseudomonadota bacterium]